MKKLFICLIFASLGITDILAQNFTKSYGAVSCQGPTGMTSVPAGMATYVDFYDDYVFVMGNGKFKYYNTNYDGSKVYKAVRQGPPAMNPIAVVIAKNYSAMNLIVQSSMMGMSIQMVYNYQWIGDGSRAAENLMSAGSFSYESFDDNNEKITCHSCQGSGLCKYCNGSGRSAYTRDGRCGVCRNGRCAGCNGKGYY